MIAFAALILGLLWQKRRYERLMRRAVLLQRLADATVTLSAARQK